MLALPMPALPMPALSIPALPKPPDLPMPVHTLHTLYIHTYIQTYIHTYTHTYEKTIPCLIILIKIDLFGVISLYTYIHAYI